MQFRITALIILFAAAGLAAPASAQSYYVALHGGYAWFEDTDFELGGVLVGEAEAAPAAVAAAATGYESHDGWRLEAEISWRRHALDSLDGAAAVGELEAWAGLVNVFYRLDLGGPVVPYLGGGAGAARVEAAGVDTGSGVVSGFDIVPAWQAGAGLMIPVSSAVAVSVDYRYLVANRLRIEDAGNRLALDFRSSAAMAGLIIAF